MTFNQDAKITLKHRPMKVEKQTSQVKKINKGCLNMWCHNQIFLSFSLI